MVLLIFDQIFLSPQAKRSVVISNTHRIYNLSLEFPNDFKKNLRRLGNIRKSQHLIELYNPALNPPPKMIFFSILAKTP